MKETKPATTSKYMGLGAAITAELILDWFLGFWFGIGVILAIGVADGLNHFIGTLTSSGNE